MYVQGPFSNNGIIPTDTETVVAETPSYAPTSVSKNMMKRIASFATCTKALDYLQDAVKQGEFQSDDGLMFKKGSTYIENAMLVHAGKFVNNMKKLTQLNLDITAKYVGTVKKNNEVFIVYEIPGTEHGELIPYSQAKGKVSKRDKLAAYAQLQKLTKAGFTDDTIMRSSDGWYVAPDTNKIVIPVFKNLRPLESGENLECLERYYRIIFSA